MNAFTHPDVFIRSEPTPQMDLPLAADGVQRHVWQGRFGVMLIEVRDGQIFVDGSLVTPAEGPKPPLGQA